MEEQLIRLLRNPMPTSNEDDMKHVAMLASRVDLNNTNPPAIIIAARHQNEVVIGILLYNGADINIKDYYGNTPLLIAASYGKYRIVEFLLQNGADPNIQDNDGMTPLMYTLQVDYPIGTPNYDRYLRTTHILLSNRANVDYQNNDGMTALMMASQLGNIGAVNALLYNRANPFIRNDDGRNAYDLAPNDDIRRIIRNYEQEINVEYQRLLMRMRSSSITQSVAKNISGFLFKSNKKSKGTKKSRRRTNKI